MNKCRHKWVMICEYYIKLYGFHEHLRCKQFHCSKCGLRKIEGKGKGKIISNNNNGKVE